MPAVWSSILGSPFVIGGSLLHIIAAEIPSELGIPFLLFGLFIVGIGLYIQFVAAPEPPVMRDDERIIAVRHPTQLVARTKIGLGIPLLIATIYLLYFTFLPYLYPTVTLILGLYFFSSGLQIYWANSLTTYYVTNLRVIKEYRLLSLIRVELPLDKVRGVQERRSITESLVGLGNVRVASGGGKSLEIIMRNMEQSTEFADDIRNLL